MTAPRFFVAPDVAPLGPAREMALPDPVARHAVQVLRLRDGDPVVLFDGTGGEYDARLVIRGKAAHAAVAAHRAVEREPAHPPTLVQAVIAPDPMDWIVRKAVELGAGAIVPVLSERSQRAPAGRLDRRVARWQQIAIAACEQCGRNRVPTVAALAGLRDWIATSGGLGDAVILEPGATTSLAVVAGAFSIDRVMVGPEGGWTADETTAVRAAGAHAAHLGNRTLRAETAALAALAALATLEALPALIHQAANGPDAET